MKHGRSKRLEQLCVRHQFHLRKFNAGLPLAEIYHYLRSIGYPSLELATIEEWLHANRCSVTSTPAQTTAAQTIQTNYPNIPHTPAYYQTAHHQPTSSSGRGRATTGANPRMLPNRPFLPFNADRFAIEAHRGGNDTGWIRDHLSFNNGHKFTLIEVIRILSNVMGWRLGLDTVGGLQLPSTETEISGDAETDELT